MNESELIQAARGGDEAAFEQLVRLHEKKIYNLCLRMCGSSEDAAEAAQDTFLALWRGLEGFREDAALSTWLYRLASNACIDLLRRSKRTVDGVSLDDEDVHLEVRDRAPTPEEHVEGRETQRLVREGVELDNEEHHRDNEAPSLAVVKKLISFADLQGGLVASVEDAFMEFYGKNASGRQALQAMKTMLSESGLTTPQNGTLTATES